jgi:VIT1/CCC1 family predicted Fe2+/Mn2+ transporter
MNYDEKKLIKEAIKQERNEITEHFLYEKLASIEKDFKNKKILLEISKDELKHYQYWRKENKKDFKPNYFKIYFYLILAKIFGLSFSLKLMEGDEKRAQKIYDFLSKKYKVASKIKQDEINHEKKLINILKDKRLTYASSIVLGLNDALVELSGTLVGLSFAFNDNEVIGITGLIMGIAAALSMSASGYLSSLEEKDLIKEINPKIAAIYTGVAYILTVIVLVLPYFIFKNTYTSLICMLFSTILIIAGYTYYISIAKEISFRKKFFMMSVISLGVSFISFLIGIFVKKILGINI